MLDTLRPIVAAVERSNGCLHRLDQRVGRNQVPPVLRQAGISEAQSVVRASEIMQPGTLAWHARIGATLDMISILRLEAQ